MMLPLLLPFIHHFTPKMDFSTHVRFLKPEGPSQVVSRTNQTVI